MLACSIDIDVVARHTSTADNLAIRCRLDHLTRDLGGRANDKGIIGPDALEQLVRGQAEALIDFVALPFQNVDALVDDFIGHQNLHCDSPFTAITPALRGAHFVIRDSSIIPTLPFESRNLRQASTEHLAGGKLTIREHRSRSLAPRHSILLRLPVAMFQDYANIYRHVRRIESFLAEEGAPTHAPAAPSLSSMLI